DEQVDTVAHEELVLARQPRGTPLRRAQRRLARGGDRPDDVARLAHVVLDVSAPAHRIAYRLGHHRATFLRSPRGLSDVVRVPPRGAPGGLYSTGRPRPRAMSTRWILHVPSPISRILASR